MRIGIIFYDDVEPIEVGILGTLSMARRIAPELSYHTISQEGQSVTLRNGLKIETDFSFAEAPAADITLITGGPGWQTQIQNQQLLHFLQQRHERGDTLVSVCTGALLLGAAGLLRNCKATTKAVYAEPESPPLETLAAIEPTCQVQAALLVDEGNIITGGGVSLCIDLTLYLIERFLSEDTSDEVARIMEYSSARVANRERLPLIIQAPTTST